MLLPLSRQSIYPIVHSFPYCEEFMPAFNEFTLINFVLSDWWTACNCYVVMCCLFWSRKSVFKDLLEEAYFKSTHDSVDPREIEK